MQRKLINFFKYFKEAVTELFQNYLKFSIKISMCIFYDVGDATILKASRLEMFNEFKRNCEMFSNFKHLTKFVFLPCQNDKTVLTIDENVECFNNGDNNFIHNDMTL